MVLGLAVWGESGERMFARCREQVNNTDAFAVNEGEGTEYRMPLTFAVKARERGFTCR